MVQTVAEAHPELYHYTTAAGLQGIIESQQLWATNIAYLNDAEEHTGFFDRRLPRVLEEPIRAAVEEMARTAEGRDHIEAVGGLDKATEDLVKTLPGIIRSSTLKFNNPFVTSFCRAPHQQAQDDGLLSQWRGYGLDGGYAIVFETGGVDRLLKEENKNFSYQHLFWGDVEYYDQNTSEKAALPETLEAEQIVQNGIREFILTQNQSAFDPLFEPITKLSCLHKHKGFREETEVRIVAVPYTDELFELAKEGGDKRPRKRVEFLLKSGTPVPYMPLFGPQPNGNLSRLPIKKVIVGPHPERLKRQKAVELLLDQHEIEARAVVSDIPYLGR